MEGAELNKAKEILAYELTKLIHGQEEADKCLEAAKSIFGGGGNAADMPSTELTADDLTDGKIGILEVLVKTKLAPSRSEARRLVQQGGISVNEEKIADPNAQLSIDGEIVVKKGKKIFHKVIIK